MTMTAQTALLVSEGIAIQRVCRHVINGVRITCSLPAFLVRDVRVKTVVASVRNAFHSQTLAILFALSGLMLPVTVKAHIATGLTSHAGWTAYVETIARMPKTVLPSTRSAPAEQQLKSAVTPLAGIPLGVQIARSL